MGAHNLQMIWRQQLRLGLFLEYSLPQFIVVELVVAVFVVGFVDAIEDFVIFGVHAVGTLLLGLHFAVKVYQQI